MNGEYAVALSEIEKVTPVLLPEQQAHCCLLKAEIKYLQMEEESSRDEMFRGLELSEPGSFLRLTLQLELGRSFERSGEEKDALEFYRSAITTCAEGEGFSGRDPLIAFLKLNRGNIPDSDNEIFEIALRKSMDVLEADFDYEEDELSKRIVKLDEHFEILKRNILGI